MCAFRCLLATRLSSGPNLTSPRRRLVPVCLASPHSHNDEARWWFSVSTNKFRRAEQPWWPCQWEPSCKQDHAIFVEPCEFLPLERQRRWWWCQVQTRQINAQGEHWQLRGSGLAGGCTKRTVPFSANGRQIAQEVLFENGLDSQRGYRQLAANS